MPKTVKEYFIAILCHKNTLMIIIMFVKSRFRCLPWSSNNVRRWSSCAERQPWSASRCLKLLKISRQVNLLQLVQLLKNTLPFSVMLWITWCKTIWSWVSPVKRPIHSGRRLGRVSWSKQAWNVSLITDLFKTRVFKLIWSLLSVK